MLKTFPSLSVLIIGLFTLSACSANNISMKSENGETITVQTDSIKLSSFDKKNAINSYNQWISRIERGLAGCIEDFPNKKMCNKEYGKARAEKIKERDTIAKMPNITMVAYRTIIRGLEGQTKNEDSNQLACLPEASPQQQEEWMNIISSVNSLNKSPFDKIQFKNSKSNNLLINKLCDKYTK